MGLGAHNLRAQNYLSAKAHTLGTDWCVCVWAGWLVCVCLGRGGAVGRGALVQLLPSGTGKLCFRHKHSY